MDSWRVTRYPFRWLQWRSFCGVQVVDKPHTSLTDVHFTALGYKLRTPLSTVLLDLTVPDLGTVHNLWLRGDEDVKAGSPYKWSSPSYP